MRTTAVLLSCLAVFVLLSALCPLRGQAQQIGYALDFSPTANYATVSLTSPPANDYTITAWVKLHTGGTLTGTRMAVLGGTNCGDSIEFLIRSETSSPTDPQHLELGRCGSFNGFSSTAAVPLNTWTHVAVTLISSNIVTYYINGSMAGSFTNDTPTGGYALGSTVNLGDNMARAFDGELYNVQIWNRVLSASEVTNNLTQQLTGSESGLYAWYPFTEGSGATTADAATAAGGSAATLVASPTWLPVANLVVTNAADNGPGSLRESIANSIPDRTITFSPNLSGATITLTSGSLSVTQNIAIDGSAPSRSVTISGNGASGIFNVDGAAIASLKGLAMVNGNAYDGGAVYGAPGTSMTLNGCTMSGNLAVEGGALLNDGAMTLIQCTLANNSGSYGGAMQCRGTTLISQSTLSANSGYYGGGGLWIGFAAVTVSNSIVSGNFAPGGTPTNIDIENVSGPLTFSGANIAQFIAGTAFSGQTPIFSDPMLQPLGDYGGPLQTMLPLQSSPAIDAAVANSISVDERGFARSVGAGPDIGAVEFQDASSVVTTTADSGVGSLRFAATYTTNGQFITFDPSLSGSTILLTSGQVILKPNLTIDASALPGGVRIDGNNNSRIFQVNNANTVTLNSLTITNGNGVGANSSGNGGGLWVLGAAVHLTINNCLFTGNHSANFGGGLGAAFVTLAVNGTTFSNNACTVGGGANIQDGVASLSNCTFSGNTLGGALELNAVQSVAVTIINSTISGNSTASQYGSALGLASSSNRKNSATLTNCTITGNTTASSSQAGAIFIQPFGGTNTVSLYNTIVSGNTAGASPSDILYTQTTTANATGSYNLIGAANGFTDGVSGNHVGVNNPQLFSLGNYGGSTLSMPPLPGSPVIDSGGPTMLTTDQRGFPRPLGLAPDIGAVEGVYNAAGPGKITSVTQGGNGSLQLGFTNYSDMAFTVLASTNLNLPMNTWSNIGFAFESPLGSGHYQFTDMQATNNPLRFYRLRVP